MNDNSTKNLALYEELEASVMLVKLGLGEIQNLSSGHRFYHLPFQLLSSGFERLMKCHICLGHHEQYGCYPDEKLFKKLSHDLIKLKEYLVENYFQQNNIPALEKDLEYIDNEELNHLIGLLSEFGKYARYYNLDVVTDAKKMSTDVKRLWEEYETKLLIGDPELLEGITEIEKQTEISDVINQHIVRMLEQFARVLCRQFTMGKLGALALQYSPVVSDFYNLKDEELGTTNYRESTSAFKEKVRSPRRRGFFALIRGKIDPNYKNKKVVKSEYKGDWPFYVDEVTIECRYEIWCVVIINGCDYALNGAAMGRYKIDSAHDGGMAILGRSVGPFIDMCHELAREGK